MMLPVTSAGIFAGVEGLETAIAVPGIDSIEITAHKGERVLPLPEASTYLGFIFSNASSTEEVTAALRQSFSALRINIKPLIETHTLATA
jgi:hypothetical protein